MVFSVIPDEVLPPDVHALKDEELAVILDKAVAIEAWLESVRAEASARIDHGRDIVGWKLVAKRAMRKWIDAADAEASLSARYPSAYDDMLKLDTPAGVERVLKRHKLKADDLSELIIKESSGTTLAREDDSRPAVGTDAKSVFTMLTDSLDAP